MADPIDQSTDLAEREREDLIRRRVIYQGESAPECLDCGRLISSARQLAVPGCTRCRDCEAEEELRDRQRGYRR